MSVINLKVLIKTIKKEAKETLYWQQVDDVHYVGCPFWFVKLTGEEFTTVRPTLLEVFRQEPSWETTGMTLELSYKEVRKVQKDVSRLLRMPERMEQGVLTPLILHNYQKRDLQFANFGGGLAALDTRYSALIKDPETPLLRRDGAVIYAGVKGDLVIISVRGPAPDKTDPGKTTPWREVVGQYLGVR